MGPAYMTPSIPIKRGRITIRGSRKTSCLVRDMIIPSFASPMEVKNPADMGCMPLAKVRNIKSEDSVLQTESTDRFLFRKVLQSGEGKTENREKIQIAMAAQAVLE